MSLARRRLLKWAVFAGAALALAPIVSVGDGALAQRRPAAKATQSGRAPACFDGCFSRCQSIGSSGAACSRTCYARCSGIVGNSDNQH
jgi:hypothetical protein